LRRQGLIANCIRFVQALHVGVQAAPAVHALLLETLEALEQAETASPLFAQFFRVKICFEQGFAPGLGACVVCSREDLDRDVFLSLDRGRVYCLQCAPFASRAVRLGAEAHAALRRIAASGPRQWSEAALSRPACAEVYRIAEGYTRYHLGLRWSHGRFVPA
jgi:DNA repair protein RecO (recombination protein O)